MSENRGSLADRQHLGWGWEASGLRHEMGRHEEVLHRYLVEVVIATDSMGSVMVANLQANEAQG